VTDAELEMYKGMTIHVIIQRIVNQLTIDYNISYDEAYAKFMNTLTFDALFTKKLPLYQLHWQIVYKELLRELNGDLEHLFSSLHFSE
jgi:hypothetical protein